MNLNAFAAPMTRMVSPSTPAQYKASTGYTQAADFTQVPAYAAPTSITVDVQALTSRELAHLDGLNIQGTLRAVWSAQTLRAADRKLGLGGDLLVFDDGDGSATWLVVHVLETWNGAWCHVAVQKQVD
jgi:hypothetical protein